MCIEIFGYKNKSAKDYAVNLGLAMQLTNILRDVKKDSEKGRIYLPQNDLVKFQYSEQDIFEKRYDANFISLMKFESDRAKDFFTKADQALDFDDKPSLFPARAMQHIYQRLLTKLEAEKFDVFNKKIKVGTFEKATISVGVWAKYRLVY
jgi:phytoene synthase